jgi:hypothetical protein
MKAFTDSFPNDIAVPALKTRYTDAYLAARAYVLLGNTIKTVGIVLGVLILVGFFAFASFAAKNAQQSDVGGGAFILVMFIGIANALLVGFIFYLLGVLVSAQGQILKASLDSAVNGSPFLTNEHRAEIMSLPLNRTVRPTSQTASLALSTTTVSTAVDSDAVAPLPTDWKCRCGESNTESETICQKCGRAVNAIF